MPSLEAQWTSSTVALHAHRLTVSEDYREGIRAHYPLRAEAYPVSLGQNQTCPGAEGGIKS